MVLTKGFKTGSADEMATELQNFCQSENITVAEIKSFNYFITTDQTHCGILIYIQL